MKVQQVVQVQILGSKRPYTYAYTFDPQEGGMPLRLGAKVEIPGNMVTEGGGAATVVKFGSDYTGPMKEIVRVIEDERREDPGLWGGFGTGDYA